MTDWYVGNHELSTRNRTLTNEIIRYLAVKTTEMYKLAMYTITLDTLGKENVEHSIVDRELTVILVNKVNNLFGYRKRILPSTKVFLIVFPSGVKRLLCHSRNHWLEAFPCT
jgi:hypothetical protein